MEKKFTSFFKAEKPVDERKNSAYHEAAKAKASAYRKEQYQKQKARLKETKIAPRETYSDEVEAALAYFSVNGFLMPAGPDREILTEAKKKLSLVFHPDRGGTHEEATELNHHCTVLSRAC